MGEELKIILALLWLPQALLQLSAWVYWLQVKEYRLDRFKLLLFSKEGRKNLSIYIILFKILGFLATIFFVKYAPIILVILLIILDIRSLYLLLGEGLRRPKLTQRALEVILVPLFGLSVIVVSFIFISFPLTSLVLLGGEFVLMMFPVLGILITIPIVSIIKRRKIEKAKKLLNEVKPLVIALTGSYGKSSTKEFLVHLLSQKYNVSNTQGSENTELGVVNRIISSVKPEDDILVVEIGAYRKGEIEKIAEIVKPKIGIITGIEEQHLALFGSKDEIMKTKFELIESLPSNGISIFNYSNIDCVKMASWVKNSRKKIQVCGYKIVESDFDDKADIESKVIKIDEKGIYFEINYKEEKNRFFSPLPGIHLLENLTCAILVSRIMGIDWESIKKSCSNIKLPPKTMSVLKLKTGSVVIDDSFNATPKGFLAAVSYLSLYKERKRVVISPGIIELGNISQKIHEGIAETTSKIADKVILTSADFEDSFRKYFGNKTNKFEVINNPKKLALVIEELIKSKNIILLEGRMPKILDGIIQKYLA